MNAWILIVVLFTADGPQEIRIEAPGGRVCEAVARDMRLRPPRFSDAVFISARCVREYEA